MPKSIIDGLFGKSPISPLQQHMTSVHSCISELKGFMVAIHEKNWTEAEAIRSTIGHKEGEADILKKKLRLSLPSTFMMPFSRRDLLDLLLIQDSIANITKDVSGLMINRKMTLPNEIFDDVIELTDVCIKTSAAALKAVNELDELLETAFGNRERKVVSSIIEDVNELESESDKIQHVIRAKLFPLEQGLPPVDVMFYYRAVEWLGELADAAQKVGSRLEVLLAK
ncbi:Phosphate transport regulator (distant homolog of PhoU) [uncultured Gammaproteobacteria bacterium]|jgi:predicted phosphate transport protein (TIGR00153 family)|uniref:TIGR00153 family protein n=1 Tax=thiotrophic endosymbiont of Bathymodiolus puteoserpentis (Logatchev) TaxID=343240 RepID=UPI0010BC6537|nr:TIGR00153 family protein [thiotrophic endosymbiont of Bathymodiolus puteoserpentis (Logatchev)]CAC9490423.1 Phosphate transport regulator (distant homolog of PhoU) [uncultured Gammaproteobacteria bacterium]CAC9586311.1 Phosphate transport regulator (distant homolog of PhoU) [uncultured Gammaproteobacteria bacterium]CAC9588097.1 Phosphate transport regulator (distant homolog of PhoU) [uncultured Gammaproteobacteria bacterium]CAC9590399.1 Phosphate transport regulator (distant homolog of PhoU)